MKAQILGIHHVTAIAAAPQSNLDFYRSVLGLRLVKRTVNFDDPGTYHFYYGAETGAPGTILTFFPWPGARRGRTGNGQVNVTSYAISEGAAGSWVERLNRYGIDNTTKTRFGQEVIAFSDPDGLELELIASLPGNAPGIGPIHSASLNQRSIEPTAKLLTETMGFRESGQEGNRFRFEAGAGGASATVDILETPDLPRALGGAGTVHHIAWRTADDAQQLEWQKSLTQIGYNVSPVMDRQYFHSIYYREPGGVLFEIATDPPGFLIDEPFDSLGMSLKLPPEYEGMRARIESALPRIRVA